MEVLVEGESDAAAVRVLLARQRLTAAARVTPMGGVTNVEHALRARPGQAVLGICDEPEALVVARALHRTGRWPGEAPQVIRHPDRHRPTAADPRELERVLGSLGFFVCHVDLEAELIRALGIPAAERILADHGALAAFRTFQGQPAQRDRDDPARLRRFLGAGSGRKAVFAEAFTTALTDDQVPEPLARLVAAVRRRC